jgi:hypothetical protein
MDKSRDGKDVLDYWRQQGIVTPDELPAVQLIGVGGIGSFTLLAMAKMGVTKLVVYDDDTIESHNIPNQLYSLEDIGLPKVLAAYNLCEEFAGVQITTVQQRLNGHAIEGVVVSGVDSMASRKDIWDRVKFKAAIPLYIEARMGAEVSRIHTLNPCDPDACKWYETTLYSDEDAIEAPCTERAIIYNGFAIAALIANQVKKYAKKEQLFREIIFDLKTLTLMTE